MARLGFGFMRMPLLREGDQKAIDKEQLKEMVDTFFGAGFTYCDTAWMYHDFMSEPTVGEVVVKNYPRDSFTVATKMPVAMVKSLEKAKSIFEAQKEKLGVEYFDYYLVHDMNKENYNKAQRLKIIDFLREKKEAGEIKRLGFSCHDMPEFIDKALDECPFFEFVQLQINYLDWDSEGVRSRECYEVCVKHDKPVMVMEPVKGGTLANIPEDAAQLLAGRHPDWTPASWALRFVASLPAVDTILSGMSTLEQVQQNTELFKNIEPLDDEDMDLLARTAAMIRGNIAIPCTSCRYCVEENTCPVNIPIPNYFALYNTETLKNDRGWTPEKNYYRNYVKQNYGRASECISCRGCERVCPQHIEISTWMTKVKVLLEDNNMML